MFRELVKGSAIYMFPALLSRGLALFLVPLYTRVLSPSDYGSLDLFMTFAGVVHLTIALEVAQGVARFYSSEPDPDRKVSYASSGLWFTIAVYSAFCAVMLVIPNLPALIMGQAGLESAFRVGLLYIWINSVFYLVQNQFRWELRSWDYLVTSVLMSVITAAVTVLLTVKFRWGVAGLLAGLAAGSAAGSCLGLYRLRASFRPQINGHHLRQMLAFSTPLVVSGIAVWLNTYVDRIVIKHFLTIEDVGLYGVGYRIASIAGLIVVGLQGALTPLVYSNFQKPETPAQLARIFKYFLATSLTAFLALTLFSQNILRAIAPPEYLGGAEVVIFLVPIPFLASVYVVAPGIGIAKRTSLLVWINASGGLLNLVLCVAFVPLMGISGAGLATLISYLAIFGLTLWASQRHYYVPHRFLPLILATMVASVLAVGLPMVPMSETARCLANGAAICLFVGVTALMKVIDITDIRHGRDVILRRFGRAS